MNRRRLLATTGAVLGTTMAGCAGLSDGSGGTEWPENCSGGSVEPETDGDHHLYLVNLDDEVHRTCLEVRRASGEVVLAGLFDAPDERGAEFREVAEWGESYEVTVTLASDVAESFTWAIESCDGSEAPGGSRNAAVRIEPDATGLTFVSDACDAIQAGTQVPTGPGWYFEVEESGD